MINNGKLLLPETIKFEYLEKKEPMTTSLEKLNKNFRLIEVIYNNKADLYNFVVIIALGAFAGFITLLIAAIALICVI